MYKKDSKSCKLTNKDTCSQDEQKFFN